MEKWSQRTKLNLIDSRQTFSSGFSKEYRTKDVDNIWSCRIDYKCQLVRTLDASLLLRTAPVRIIRYTPYLYGTDILPQVQITCKNIKCSRNVSPELQAYHVGYVMGGGPKLVG